MQLLKVTTCFILLCGMLGRISPAVALPNAFDENLNKPQLVVQTGHTDIVNVVAISPDSRMVISGSEDGTLKLWDIETAREIRTFSGHDNGVTSVAFSPDGKYIASASHYERNWWEKLENYSFIKIWDVTSGKELHSLKGHGSEVTSVVFAPDGKHLVTASRDKLIFIWDIVNEKIINRLVGHKDTVNAVIYSPDGKKILSASDDKTIRIWNATSGNFEKSLYLSSDIKTLSISQDGRRLLSVVSNSSRRKKQATPPDGIILWNTEDWSKWTLTTGNTMFAAFSPVGNKIISCSITDSMDSKLKLWNSETGKQEGETTQHIQLDHMVAWAPNGKFVISANYDHTLIKWDIKSNREILFLGAAAELHALAVSNSNHDVIASSVSAIERWNLNDGTVEYRYSAPLGEVWSIEISSDNRYLIAQSEHNNINEISIYELKTGSPYKKLKGKNNSFFSGYKITSNSKKLIIGVSDEGIKTYNIASGKFEGTNIKSTDSSHTEYNLLDITNSNMLLVGQGVDLQIYDLNKRRQTKFAGWHKLRIDTGAFSPDGKFVASAGLGGEIRVWDVDKGSPYAEFSRHSGEVNTVLFTPDNRFVVSCGKDKTIKIWDLARKRLHLTLEGHVSNVRAIAFSQKPNFLLSASHDGTVMLWDITTGKWLAKLISFTDGSWAVVDPEGRFDTNNLEEIKGLHWIMPDDPLTPLPLETFMKEYYEPRLLPRILNGDTFKPVKNLMSLNRVLPTVTISPKITREGKGDTVTVTVQVSGPRRKIGDKEKQTGVADLKLFRAGQLVGFKEGTITLEKDGTQTITFNNIRLPRKAETRDVEFSAYAFNDDGIKSLTSRINFAIPKDITPAKGKAYLVNIGVNRYQNSAWNLQYAASDALKIRQSLESRIPKAAAYSDIIPITLTDENATKENIKAVFDLLAGNPVSADLKQHIPNADKLAKATPEDLLIISFSGHGHVDDNGIFYSFTHDTGQASNREVTPDLLSHIISSDELSRWLRYVDAGDMAMIVDACHSAATVGEGFKPGPMGSRGLGQLAYDKGMRILAASQADDVALESDKLLQGLLTYSLVHDGLDAFQADFKPVDKSITLSEMLAYAVDRVPKLYKEVKSGNLSNFGRGETSRGTVIQLGDRKKSSLQKKNHYQTPALFDFTRKQKGDVAVAKQ